MPAAYSPNLNFFFPAQDFCATINPMPILVISDIHANLIALESVLSAAGPVDAVWCLGDLVGYGPDPNECIERVQNLSNLTCIIGNHDSAVLNQIDPYSFNSEARYAIEWTQRILNESSLSFLRGLPELVDTSEMDNNFKHAITLAHGSPRQPVWEYLLDLHTATQNFEYFDTAYCFVGHTHLPIIFHYPQNGVAARPVVPESDTRIVLSPRAIINPGSVGQPRDRNPLASFMLYDPVQEILEYYRVPYDIQTVQQRMKVAGLPDRHIRRLEAGW
jgi:predicted phosphodiesterase